MRRTSFLLLGVLGLAPVARPVCAKLNVWTVAETRRVLREDPPETQKAAVIYAAKNEWRSFQILLRSDKPVREVRVVPGDLRGPKGAVLRAEDARLYRQHQFKLDIPSPRNKAFRPGWYPDALIPSRNPLTGEPLKSARFKAQPFDLPADETHGFWIDIFVPENARAGEYKGTYRVATDNAGTVEIPVAVVVWDFALPRVSTMKTAFGSPANRMRSYYRQRAKEGKESYPTDWEFIDRQCAELLSRHRINATPPSDLLTPVAQPDGSYRIPEEKIAKLRDFVNRYHVNALRVPHPGSVVKDPIKEKKKLHAWLHAFDEVAKQLGRDDVVLYTYLRDEPNDEAAYHYVQKWGRAVREARSAVKVLVVEQTWTQNPKWGNLYGCVDIWCPLFPLFKEESAKKRQALGEKIWTYTALCQGKKPTPWWEIDFPLLNYRVPGWIMRRYGMSGLLYWGGMSYWRQVDDPWTDPKTLDRRNRRKDGKGPLYNGEGSLVYPARAVGYDGIAPSIRLKALRDGIQDYEYLAIAERLGKGKEARAIIRSVAPSWFEWNKNPAAYDAARRKVAELIVRAKQVEPK